MEIDGICKVLGEVHEGDSGKADSELISYKNALLGLTEVILSGGVERQWDMLARVVIVVSGHCGPHYWTNDVNRQLANDVLANICSTYQCLDCPSLLAKNADLLSAIFRHIKKILTKDSWKHYPVYKQALIWVIKCLKFPYLAPHLSLLLPPTLWMLDDYSDYHRILALSTLTHIIQHMDPTELRWHGRADLLYQGLKPLLYVSSSAVVHALHPCLLALLPVLDYSPTIPDKPKNIDKVFIILLDALAKESSITLQRAYTFQLKGYIIQLGIFSARHIKQCLPLLLSALDHADPDGEKLRKYSLHALSALMSFAWPRTPAHKITILKALSKLVLNSRQLEISASEEQDILGLIVECLTLLMAACPELKSQYQWLEQSCNHPTMQLCLQQTYSKAVTQQGCTITSNIKK